MAIRPIFIATDNILNPYSSKDIEFEWIKGMSYLQKCKRRDSLKKEIEKLYEIKTWLEVSTKSDKEIGILLSAKNLLLTINDEKKCVEDIYQMAKVFENGYLKTYIFDNKEFDKDPYGLFYDYIYMLALYQNKDLHEKIKEYNIFTDIEFNPNRSINTQARAIAIFKTLLDNESIDVIDNKKEFIDYYKENVKLKRIITK